jgi:hypothetical protein
VLVERLSHWIDPCLQVQKSHICQLKGGDGGPICKVAHLQDLEDGAGSWQEALVSSQLVHTQGYSIVLMT